MQPILFSPFKTKHFNLKNRITMLPFFVGYGNIDGTVNDLVLNYYKQQAASGVSMLVVESATVHPSGLGSIFGLRIDDDSYIEGLAKLAQAVKAEGAVAILQINHAGRFAMYGADNLLAPSVLTDLRSPEKPMCVEQIGFMIECYGKAALRAKQAGFDGVEIHGGTGYLIVQFLSARTNLRDDSYGGSLENRMRFSLNVTDAVRTYVGNEYPVGYRFNADEELPDGLHPDETKVLAQQLAKRDLEYLSVTAGVYEAFVLPEYLEMEKQEAYMAHYAGIIKQTVPGIPVIAAGRIQTPETASRLINDGITDLIGLARVLFADPLWPKKAEGKISEPIVACKPGCLNCMTRISMAQKAFCVRWPKERRDAIKNM